MVENNRTVLLVEDNEDHAHLVARHLRKIKHGGTTVQHVTCLADALETLGRTAPDAVLLDLGLPDSPLQETLSTVVKRFPALPVLVLTSLNDLDFAARAVQQGAQDYLVKTELGPEILDRAIRYAVERKHAQRELQQYALKLEESNRHLESFAHTLAHEVRSPLTVVSGCLQIIDRFQSEHLDADTRGLVNDSLTAIQGMTELVEGLLEFSQSTSAENDLETTELEAVFFHVYTMLRPALREAGAELTHDVLPAVTGNEVQLRQLLQNLIVNAIKYRGDDPPKIHVSCRDSADAWTIAVSDNGAGIAASNQERIFDAFTRLDHTRHISGVGIGLAFCQRIAEHHRAKLWVESEVGQGSTFYFSLPK